MAQAIEELRSAGVSIIETAEWLARLFAEGAETDPAENDADTNSARTTTPASTSDATSAAATETIPQEIPAGPDLEQAPNEAPASDPPLRLEDVRAVLAELSREGHTAEIRELLRRYGADRLSAIDPANYRALLIDAEGLRHAD